MNMVLSAEERNWAIVAHLCGLLWLAGGFGPQVIDGKPYRYPFCLRLVK